jgi:FkbM family methyltransferase
MKRFINSLLALGGLKIQRLQAINDTTVRLFESVPLTHLRPEYFFDVGANHGNWTRRVIKRFTSAKVLMIEPQHHLRSYSDDLTSNPKIEWITAGVSNVGGTGWLTVAANDHSSTFVLTGQQAAEAGLTQVEVPLVTLNQLVSDREGKVPQVVKIDAEGFDLKVIDGASNLIGITEVFFMEAAICAHGIENTLLSVVTKMDELGYQPFDVTELNYSPKQGVLWLVEIAFIRKGGRVASAIGASY